MCAVSVARAIQVPASLYRLFFRDFFPAVQLALHQHQRSNERQSGVGLGSAGIRRGDRSRFLEKFRNWCLDVWFVRSLSRSRIRRVSCLHTGSNFTNSWKNRPAQGRSDSQYMLRVLSVLAMFLWLCSQLSIEVKRLIYLDADVVQSWLHC